MAGELVHIIQAEINKSKELVEEAKTQEEKAQANDACLNNVHRWQGLEAELAAQDHQYCLSSADVVRTWCISIL